MNPSEDALNSQPCAGASIAPFAWRIERFAEVDSTNLAIKRAIVAGQPEGLAIAAARQTAGYGRQGRAWSSPEGSLYTSVLLKPELSREAMRHLPTLSLVVGLAVRDAVLQTFAGLDAGLLKVKWPNDVLYGDAKLCGISTELVDGALCVGIGVNVFAPACANASLPGNESKRAVASGKYRFAYAAHENGDDSQSRPDAVEELLEATLDCLRRRYVVWSAEGFAPFKAEFDHVMAWRGRIVRLETMDGAVRESGVVCGVDEVGRLLLRDAAGVCRAATSGEVHVVC